jgi:hypothetical protein
MEWESLVLTHKSGLLRTTQKVNSMYTPRMPTHAYIPQLINTKAIELRTAISASSLLVGALLVPQILGGQ